MSVPVALIEAVALETRKQRFERNGRVKIFDPMLPATEHELADAELAILTTLRWLAANGPSDDGAWSRQTTRDLIGTLATYEDQP